MCALKVNFSLFRAKRFITESLFFTHVKYYNKKIDTVAKRGSMLIEFITNKDKRNKWHFNILSDKPKARTFEKIHKPHRRRAVLNSVFIKNITDVISTGDTIPEISKYSMEITGVKISPCNKILNVFWQVPVNQSDSCEDIGKILSQAAPKIRAELISRNVLGRVPYIFFLRDGTNEKISAFEKAMQKLDLGPESDSNIIVDDSFTNDIFSFKSEKVEKKETEAVLDDRKEELTDPNNPDAKEEYNALPQNPSDMKCDIFGLNHDLMMEKVIAMKKKIKGPQKKTALITPDSLKDNDLFDKIPGICFEANSTSRDEILKKFHAERKILMQKKKERSSDYNHQNSGNFDIEDDDAEYDTYQEDFLDDESNTSHH